MLKKKYFFLLVQYRNHMVFRYSHHVAVQRVKVAQKHFLQMMIILM